jgi:hypothetical protein
MTIETLIEAAGRGAGKGIEALRMVDPPIPVQLQEFEIEVNYACETEFRLDTNSKLELKFWVFKAEFSAKTSYKRTTTYGLKVRFVFIGKEEEEEEE